MGARRSRRYVYSSTATATAASSSAPPLPQKPESLNSVATRTASNYTSSPYNRSSPYGYSSYSSPYNRFGSSMGGMGGMYGSPYGGMYGGGYGGMYGGGYGGYGGMGMNGAMGGPGPNGEMSLTQSFNQSTQATFQIIESIVGAFGGFAQMLESTYMATHSSFFAMVSVAEQLSSLRQTLGSVLGIFTLWRWLRTLFAKITGRAPPADATSLTPAAFASFTGSSGPLTLPDGSPAPAKPSKKPFIFFMVAVFGLPFLMGKLIRALARNHEEEERKRIEANPALAYDHALQQASASGQPMDPSKLDFCRLLYDFTPDTNAQNTQGIDLAVKKGDLVAVLSKTDPMGQPSEWWKCRSRDGGIGYLPAPYLEKIEKRQPAQIAAATGSQKGSPAGSRAQTMSGNGSRTQTISERTKTMTSEKTGQVDKPKVEGKPEDINVESFQKGTFYS
ncbi:MAG: Peroxisomal membrane protein PAS20 [Bathelium mastoideum]|nr:MAG: Peroxisomal membrane protein PAS20 [Bathelium mastoideum]